MDLTPITIPGKRKRRGEGKRPHSHRKTPKRGLGPNLQIVDVEEHQLKQHKPITEPKKRNLKNLKSRRKMSQLEKLPTEILESVLLYAMNIDFPRSSPIIGGKLSSEIVYHQTVLAAFGPTWDRLHDVDHLCRDEPVDYFLASLQSQILLCRWACTAVILRAKDAWMVKNNKQIEAWWCVSPEVQPPESGDESIESRTDLKKSDVKSDKFKRFYRECFGRPSDITAERYFEIDFYQFTIVCSPTWNDRWPCRVYNGDIERSVEVVDSLLSGPWNEDQIKLLYWIVKSGVQIDWLKSTSGEVAFEGLKTAISTGDTRAIYLMCWIGVYVKIDTNLVNWALRNAGGNKNETMKHLLLAWTPLNGLRSVPTILDRFAIEEELEIYKAEALRKNDQEMLKFVIAVEASYSLKSALTSGIDQSMNESMGAGAELDSLLGFEYDGEIGQ